MEHVDCVVVGAGVVGLAVARALALAGREVLVLEAAAAIGTGTSSRNSEVIHAGIYYPQGTLKASLCVQGNAWLYDYCTVRGISHQRCGKLIVATSAAQLEQLELIRDKAVCNGVLDLVYLTGEEAQRLEPKLCCEAALLSPSTGVVDSHALMLTLQGDLENAGGMVVLNSAVRRMGRVSSTVVLETADGSSLCASLVVNAAGLGALDLARQCVGLAPQYVPQAFYAKGNYFTLAGRSPFSHLIYPVPEQAGLGVHLTVDLGGQAKFGPDVQWVASADDLMVDPARSNAFYAEVRKYWPELQDGALLPGYAGIRPKVSGPGEPAADFMIQGPASHGVAGLVNLFGIESPGLTAALAIGQYVVDMNLLY
ncbi:NAD(P)/FAD-dependent oxidoreductase [Rhodoferax sp.]|uniref:NAD(P)/FAD-dependent oxidoreductase n=1 Tax=Rhodoferax sp. TaxID=50421 RepID=UPI00262F0EF9|nr:NAD(P)/FAD-dependent oxidoreductase [Rhodoferax sp.]MDD2924969.1 NAD(P)/FAD-dependent oxidoreductase [Rhodoferax sp.]